MRNYIEKVDLKKFSEKYDRSYLSFKFALQDALVATVGDTDIICLKLSPSGYDDPKCFKNGNFDPNLIDPKSHFIANVSDFEVYSDKLNEKQKRELLELMHSHKEYSQDYYRDYRKYHTSKLKAEFDRKIKIAERLKISLTRSKGANYYNDYIQALKDEYREKMQEIQLTFTNVERI